MTNKERDEELWKDVNIEINRLNDLEIINKLKDARPFIHEYLLLDARMALKLALYQDLKDIYDHSLL